MWKAVKFASAVVTVAFLALLIFLVEKPTTEASGPFWLPGSLFAVGFCRTRDWLPLTNSQAQ
jgi:hypothetical protein